MAISTGLSWIRARGGKQAVKDWMGHPALQIDYINSFTRVED